MFIKWMECISAQKPLKTYCLLKKKKQKSLSNEDAGYSFPNCIIWSLTCKVNLALVLRHSSREKGEAPTRLWEGWNQVSSQTPYAPETLGGLNKTLYAPGPRDPIRDWARPAFECLLWRLRSAVACHRDRGSGCSRPGRCGVWPKSSWRRLPLAPL